jgi:dipeptidyl-peptidase-4
VSTAGETFPRQLVRTRQFTCGAPRTFTVAPDGSRVVFLRSNHGTDPDNRLWVLDVESGAERLVADPTVLLGGDDEHLPAAERARRERARELGGGIVVYDTDPSCKVAVVALAGRLFLVDLDGDTAVELPCVPGAYDPRLAPSGDAVSYVAGRDLRLVDRGGQERPLASSADPDVSWGSAEFVAAEEMGRTRGHWWAPDGGRLAVARVDVGPVQSWHLADPAQPAEEPVVMRYPAAGTPNARVDLVLVDLAGGTTPVVWDSDRLPYLVDVRWADEGLLVTVQARDQRTIEILVADPAGGATSTRLRQTDPVWVDIVDGTPAWLGDRVVTTVDDQDTRRVAIDGEPVTPAGLHVREVRHTDAATGSVLVTASEEDPTVVDVYRVGAGGEVARLTGGGGVHDAPAAGGDVVVIWSQSPDRDGAQVEVLRGGAPVAGIDSHAETPIVRPHADFSMVTERRLRAAVVMPSAGTVEIEGPLPVLMDPYGGPHMQRVLRARSRFLTSQWLADEGFALVVIDGRGTPGRGPSWERDVHGDLAGPVLDDQVDALHALAGRDDRLDLGRVGMRGWSFGGYLSALAVLRRPDVFHAAVAGAPVTDWALYDTHYTERYLGHPDESPDAYRRSSIIEDAARLERPLLLIHGLADDNVVVAHTLRLSEALLRAGRPHQVLPLSRVTHMSRDEAVTENLLRLQVDFFREHLR